MWCGISFYVIFSGQTCSPEGSDAFVRKYFILSKLIFLLLISEVTR